jgi:hypothetical protein
VLDDTSEESATALLRHPAKVWPELLHPKPLENLVAVIRIELVTLGLWVH